MRGSLCACVLVALYSLADFGAVSLLQFDSFTRAIYVQYRASFDPTLAAVLSLMLVACTAGLLLAEGRLLELGARAIEFAWKREEELARIIDEELTPRRILEAHLRRLPIRLSPRAMRWVAGTEIL